MNTFGKHGRDHGVHVDNAKTFGRMSMCHIIAAMSDELLEMAERLGLNRRRVQPGSYPHFVVSLG